MIETTNPVRAGNAAGLGNSSCLSADSSENIHSQSVPQEAIAPNWLEAACFDAEGQLVPNLATAMAVLRSAPQVSKAFAYDEMLCAPILKSRLPSLGPRLIFNHYSLPRPVTDTDVSQLQEWIQQIGVAKLSKDTIHQAIDLRARECAFHPVQDYLNDLNWDNHKRLDTWLATYLGAEPTDYSSGIGALFLISMVTRIFQPGCKCDYMLVLEGPQGAMKSTACAILGGKWFSDSLPDVTTGKDVAQHLPGKWLIEISELSGMKKAEASTLKAFITRPVERCRPSYGHKEVIQPRQCVFIGTTNEDFYLKDVTGGRRFWPVKVGRINADALRRDRDQLFDEAVHRYGAGEKWWPDAAFERTHIQPEQKARFDNDPWQDKIASFLENKSRVTVNQVAEEALGIEIALMGTTEQRRIGNILKVLGWKSIRDSKGRGFVPGHDA